MFSTLVSSIKTWMDTLALAPERKLLSFPKYHQAANRYPDRNGALALHHLYAGIFSWVGLEQVLCR